MAFLEKAWAKASGNYEQIVAGWSAESVRFITGAPTTSYYKRTTWTSAAQAWDIISTSDAGKYIMLAATGGVCDLSTSWNGLCNAHAFTILAAYTVSWANGTKTQLF